jgi:DNA-binding NtrC family response regulator
MNNSTDKILIVEDELIVAGDLQMTLRRAGHTVCGIAQSVPRALEIIDKEKPWLVFLDIFLKGEQTGIDLAMQLHRRNIAFIFLSANSSQQVLREARVTKPYGFIVKPFREKDILVTLDIARYRYDQDNLLLQKQISSVAPGSRNVAAAASSTETPNDKAFHGIVGQSPAMLEIFDVVRQVAPLDTSVLILGDSGTGKEGIASLIHRLSPRHAKPFIKVNCAALPLTLIESELFGHEKGSFTGAFEKRIGKFEAANGGTIFLDEIGEMLPDMQVKLLRVLQEKEIERIGGNATIRIDVRVIAATNRNLEKEIAEGKFRLDLYYRLHVFPISLPSLRDRPGDIPLLVQHFIDIYAARDRRPTTGITSSAIQLLQSWTWPGNVRELQHQVERAVLLCRDNTLRECHFPDLPAIIQSTPAPHSSDNAVKTIDELERDHILAVLAKCNNRIAGPGGAASLLNIPPSTLSSKMKRLGIVKRHIL